MKVKEWWWVDKNFHVIDENDTETVFENAWISNMKTEYLPEGFVKVETLKYEQLTGSAPESNAFSGATLKIGDKIIGKVSDIKILTKEEAQNLKEIKVMEYSPFVYSIPAQNIPAKPSEPILLWSFYEAPEEYRKVFDGDSPKWLAVIPAGMKVPNWLDSLAPGSDSEYGLDDGRTVLVGHYL